MNACPRTPERPVRLDQYQVDEITELYRGMYHANLAVARAAAGQVPTIAPLDQKWTLMRAVHLLVEGCAAIAERLAELRSPAELVGRPTTEIRAAAEELAASPDWRPVVTFVRGYVVAHAELCREIRDSATGIGVVHDRRLFGQLAAALDDFCEWMSAIPAVDPVSALNPRPEQIVAQFVPAESAPSLSGAEALPVRACPRRTYPEWATFVPPRPPRAHDDLEAGVPAVKTPQDVATVLRHGLQIEFVAMDVPMRNMAEFHELPLEFYRDMARHAHDEMRHTLMLFQEFERLGVDYRTFTFEAPDYYELMAPEDLGFRLCVLSRTGEAEAIETFVYLVPQLSEAGYDTVARMFDHALSDEVRHAAYGNKWLRYLVGTDDAAVGTATTAILERFNQRAIEVGLGARALREVDYLAADRSLPVDELLRRMAGFSESEVLLLTGNV